MLTVSSYLVLAGIDNVCLVAGQYVDSKFLPGPCRR